MTLRKGKSFFAITVIKRVALDGDALKAVTLISVLNVLKSPLKTSKERSGTLNSIQC